MYIYVHARRTGALWITGITRCQHTCFHSPQTFPSLPSSPHRILPAASSCTGYGWQHGFAAGTVPPTVPQTHTHTHTQGDHIRHFTNQCDVYKVAKMVPGNWSDNYCNQSDAQPFMLLLELYSPSKHPAPFPV